jgi:hypothetical protein
MIQQDAIVDRAARLVQRDDEDALFDSWLASLSSRELELVLNGLAEPEAPTRLEASA